jgi:ubiquinone biosynthesis monooxygenase Coq7
VWIYRGILSAVRDPRARQFGLHHLATERTNMALMRGLVPLHQRSVLSPAWAAAGYVTGLCAVFAGANVVFITIDAVEAFVDEHYRRQIEALEHGPHSEKLCPLLERCRTDEIAHRDEARRYAITSSNRFTICLADAIARGSAAAADVARVI